MSKFRIIICLMIIAIVGCDEENETTQEVDLKTVITNMTVFDEEGKLDVEVEYLESGDIEITTPFDIDIRSVITKFDLSQGAVSEPISGSVVDFSDGGFKQYTISQDGVEKGTIKVTIKRVFSYKTDYMVLKELLKNEIPFEHEVNNIVWKENIDEVTQEDIQYIIRVLGNGNSLDEEKRVTELLLTRLFITELPSYIGALDKLKVFNIGSNNLTSPLNESIGDLSNLEHLYLDQNELTYLPESMGKLVNLKGLDLRRNGLESLPQSIGDMTNLEYIYASENRLESPLPDSLGDLQNLEYLYLYSNLLGDVPESITNLSKLKGLRLGDNKLISLPNDIGELVLLENLSVPLNQLKNLPESIEDLVNLWTLNLAKNKFTSLPTTIASLNYLIILNISQNTDLKCLDSSIWNIANSPQECYINYEASGISGSNDIDCSN
ncbi:MAG: hypothetical protein HRT66_11265 [Flavobacteriaceae bacterium]|nr:hypothetical protein [Flavobacteriaceae bacterium]